MTPLSDLLEQAARLLGSVPSGVVATLGDVELLDHVAEVEALGRLVDAWRVEAAGEVDARSNRFLGEAGLARRQLCASGTLLVEQITRVTHAEARRRVLVGAAIAPRTSLLGEQLSAEHERVREAFVAGNLSVDAAAVIIRHLAEAARTASPELLRDAEEDLVEQGTLLSADLLAIQARVRCSALDPDGVEPREEQLRRRRSFRIGREADGLTPFSGLADPVNAGLLRAALAERTAPSRTPRFLDSADLPVTSADRADVEADPVLAEAALDARTREQRDFDVVFGLLVAGIRRDNDAVGSLHGTATVSVVVGADDLLRGTGAAWIDDVLSPVATATTQQIACDGGIRLLIEGRKGEVLWEGRRERYFTPAQRRGLAVRDGGCIWPQCTAPPSWCHAHHVVEWKHGGATDVDNGVLLCSFHHHRLHTSAFRLRMNGGCPELLAPSWMDREQRWRPVTKSRRALRAAA